MLTPAAVAASAAHAVAVVAAAVSLKAVEALAAQRSDSNVSVSVNVNATIVMMSILYETGVEASLVRSAPMLPDRPASASPLVGTHLCPNPQFVSITLFPRPMTGLT